MTKRTGTKSVISDFDDEIFSRKKPPRAFEDDQDSIDGAKAYQKDIKKWRRAFQNKKQKLQEMTQNLAQSEVKIDLLVQKLKDKDNQLKRTRRQLRQMTLQSRTTKQQLASLTFQKMDLERQLQSGVSGGVPSIQLVDRSPNVNQKRQEQFLKQKQLRQIQEQRKKILQGVDLIQSQSLDGNVFNRKGLFVPLKNDIKFVKNRYDKSISSFFDFYRFLFTSSIVTALIFLYLIIQHIITYDGSYSQISNSFYPRFVLFSSFKVDDTTTDPIGKNQSIDYIIILFVYCIILFIYSVQKWVRFDKDVRLAEMREEQTSVFTSVLVGGWDWTLKSKQEGQQLKQSLVNEITTILQFQVIKQRVSERKCMDKCKKCSLRTCTILFSLILLGGGGAAIVSSYVFRTQITNAFGDQGFLASIASFIAPLVLSTVNILVPFIIVKITKCEKWDFQSTLVKQQVWRLYIASMLNVVILIIINAEFLLKQNWFRDSTLLKSQQDADGNQRYQCNQDQISLVFFQNVMVQWVVNIIVILVIPLVFKCIAACRKKKQWKPEFNVAQDVIKTLFYQMLLWMAMLMFPFVTLLAPFLQYIAFKFVLLKLRKFTIKPRKAGSGNTGSYIMLFYIFSMAIVILAYAFFMVSNIPFCCGPFDRFSDDENCNTLIAGSYQFALQPMRNRFAESGFAIFIYNLTAFTPILWCLCGFLIVAMVFRTNHLSIMRYYFRNKITDQQKQLETLNATISRLKKQLNFNRI